MEKYKEKDEMKKSLFVLNKYDIREKQGYLLESSQKLIDYVYGKYNLSQVSSIEIKPNELKKLGIVHNRHGIEIHLNVESEAIGGGCGYGRPYFSNGGGNSIAYIVKGLDMDGAGKVVLRHELIHCLDYNKYWKRKPKISNGNKGKGSQKNNFENAFFEEHNFKEELEAFTYKYDIIERFAWLAEIEDEMRRCGTSVVLGKYRACYKAFKAGMNKKRPANMAELKDNFPAICIYNEACLPTSGILYFMPRVLTDTNITQENFFTTLTDEQFEEMRATLYDYLKRNWRMIENAALQMWEC